MKVNFTSTINPDNRRIDLLYTDPILQCVTIVLWLLIQVIGNSLLLCIAYMKQNGLYKTLLDSLLCQKCLLEVCKNIEFLSMLVIRLILGPASSTLYCSSVVILRMIIYLGDLLVLMEISILGQTILTSGSLEICVAKKNLKFVRLYFWGVFFGVFSRLNFLPYGTTDFQKTLYCQRCWKYLDVFLVILILSTNHRILVHCGLEKYWCPERWAHKQVSNRVKYHHCKLGRSYVLPNG